MGDPFMEKVDIYLLHQAETDVNLYVGTAPDWT
jgi:hypothetical protein